MLGLDIGDNCKNYKCHYALYRLLEKEVHDLRINYDFLETATASRNLSAFVSQKEL